MLRSALIHAVGASGYVPYNDLLQAQLKAQKLQEVVDQLNTALDIRNTALRQLVAVQKLAKRWAAEMGLEYEDELEFQRNLDAENEVAATVF
ncbi:hypothetical protein D3C80_1865900 [compost metagenome]